MCGKRERHECWARAVGIVSSTVWLHAWGLNAGAALPNGQDIGNFGISCLGFPGWRTWGPGRGTGLGPRNGSRRRTSPASEVRPRMPQWSPKATGFLR